MRRQTKRTIYQPLIEPQNSKIPPRERESDPGKMRYEEQVHRRSRSAAAEKITRLLYFRYYKFCSGDTPKI